MLFICNRSLRCVSDKAAMSWQWGFLCLGTERPMVVSAADFRVPFSKFPLLACGQVRVDLW